MDNFILVFRVGKLQKLDYCIILNPNLLNSFTYCLTYCIIFQVEIPNSSKLWGAARWFFCKYNCSIVFFFKNLDMMPDLFPSSSFFTIGHINIIALFIEIITKATIFKSNLLCAELSASHSLLFQTTFKVRWVSQRGKTNVLQPAKVRTRLEPRWGPCQAYARL